MDVSIHTTGWRRLIGCLKSQVIFRKRATNHRALLRKITCKDKTSYGSWQPCITHTKKLRHTCEVVICHTHEREPCRACATAMCNSDDYCIHIYYTLSLPHTRTLMHTPPILPRRFRPRKNKRGGRRGGVGRGYRGREPRRGDMIYSLVHDVTHSYVK